MQSGNSNQPLPQAAAGVAEGFQPLYAARSWKRLVNFLIDYACSVVLSYLFVFFLGILLLIFIICLGGRPQVARIPNPVLQAIGMTGWIAGFLLYYGVQEYFWGKTLGKFLTRTMVVSADGDRPTLGQVVGRAFSRFIPSSRSPIYSEVRIR